MPNKKRKMITLYQKVPPTPTTRKQRYPLYADEEVFTKNTFFEDVTHEIG
jgi:hypothetical protein